MGYRFDMRDKSVQQQAIVRDRDKKDERIKNESREKEEEILRLTNLLDDNWIFDNSINHGGNLEITLLSNDNTTKKTVIIKNNDNINRAKKLLNLE